MNGQETMDRLVQRANADAATIAPMTAAAYRNRGDQAINFNDIRRRFYDQYTTFELGGTFNIRDDGLAAYNDNADGFPLWSREYIQSLRSFDHYKLIHDFQCISTAAAIDLCRCPAIFAMGDETLISIILTVSFAYHLEGLSQAQNEFLRTDRYRVSAYESLVVSAVQGDASCIRQALRTLIGCLSCGEAVDRAAARAVDDYFNMEFEPWLGMLFANHVAGSPAQRYMAPTMSVVTEREYAYEIVAAASMRGAVQQYVMRATAHGLEADMPDEKARQLDLYYANLVHGAAVRIPLAEVWSPNNELEHTEQDSEAFFKVMWRCLRDVIESSVNDKVRELYNAAPRNRDPAPQAQQQQQPNAQQQQQQQQPNAQQQQQQPNAQPRPQNNINNNPRGGPAIDPNELVSNILKSVRRVKYAKQLMKDVWDQSKEFRISDRVHMTEMQVLDRLATDGIFPYLNRSDPSAWYGSARQHGQAGNGGDDGDMVLENMHACFYMRRKPEFRYAFAAAVGKRQFSERIASTNKAAIIEHHRSVQWSEGEYVKLVAVVQQHASLLARDLGQFRLNKAGMTEDQKVWFTDYCNAMHPRAYTATVASMWG